MYSIGINWNRSQVIIPLSSNYPGIDALLWNAEDEQLWFLQITILNPISEHIVNIFEEGGLAEKWIKEVGILYYAM